MAELPDGTARGSGTVPDPERAPGPGTRPERERAPGWREVLLVAALVLAIVFGVELLSTLVPPVREAFRGLPVTIVVLVAGTIGVLLWIALRRPRG